MKMRKHREKSEGKKIKVRDPWFKDMVEKKSGAFENHKRYSRKKKHRKRYEEED